MKRFAIVTACILSVGISCFAAAAVQEGMPAMPKPTKEHEWLKKFIGHWETTSKGQAGAGAVMEVSGTIDSQALGGFWVVNKMDARMQGMAFKGIQTLGYDAQKKKYIGTWIDTTAGFMWKYEGTVVGNKLSLEADGPDMTTPGKMARYRDSYEFKTADHVIVKSEVKVNGAWTTYMEGNGKRKKVVKKK